MDGLREQKELAVDVVLAADAFDERVLVGRLVAEQLLMAPRVPLVEMHLANEEAGNFGGSEAAVQPKQEKQPLQWLRVTHQQHQLIDRKRIDLLQPFLMIGRQDGDASANFIVAIGTPPVVLRGAVQPAKESLQLGDVVTGRFGFHRTLGVLAQGPLAPAANELFHPFLIEP